jgi:hypothetical protein
MAAPVKLLEQGEIQFFSVASDDPGVEPGSTPGDFRVKLAQPLLFPGGGDAWVMTIVFASFQAPSTELFQIATNLNMRQTIGTQSTDTVVTFPATVGAGFSWVPTSTIPVWLPLASELVSEVEIEIAPVATSLAVGPAASFVTIAIRRAGIR